VSPIPSFPYSPDSSSHTAIIWPIMAALRVASTCLRQSAARSIHQSLSVRGLATAKSPKNLFESLDTFTDRHVGPDDNETEFMLSKLGFDSMESFLAATVPHNIRIAGSTVSNASIPALSETELHASAKRLGRKNEQFKSFFGMGYHNAVVPPVILRNVCHTLSATLALC
jgi:glycine dehydrogenase